MEAIFSIIILAILVEAVVETVKMAIEGGIKWPNIAAMVLGIAVCVLANKGILALVGVEFPMWADAILSGILVSRGSNFISDLFDRVNAGK